MEYQEGRRAPQGESNTKGNIQGGLNIGWEERCSTLTNNYQTGTSFRWKRLHINERWSVNKIDVNNLKKNQCNVYKEKQMQGVKIKKKLSVQVYTL